jgi:hypothetical protein
MFELGKIIGKNVVSIRGWKERKNQKNIVAEYILFDDGETYIVLSEQDYYCYHDCSISARHIEIRKNKEHWKQIKNNVKYGDANIDC